MTIFLESVLSLSSCTDVPILLTILWHLATKLVFFYINNIKFIRANKYLCTQVYYSLYFNGGKITGIITKQSITIDSIY